MKYITIPILALLASLSQAVTLTATFDEYSEGFFAPSLDSGGITFSNLHSNLPGGGENFVIEASNPTDLGSTFTPPNVLGVIGYVPGTGTAFGRFQTMDMRASDLLLTMNSISLDVYTFVFQNPSNTVTLAG